MADLKIWLLKDFFRKFGASPNFLEQFPGGFLMIRFRDTPPTVAYLKPEEGFSFKVGSDEDTDLDYLADPTLEPEHLVVAYHTGFRGWTVEDLGTSFGTLIQDERITAQRPVLLTDMDVVKPGGGLLQLQFYAAETLHKRMTKAGVTRRIQRDKLAQIRKKASDRLKQGQADDEDDEDDT